MAVDLELAPKSKRAAGEPCCAPVDHPEDPPDPAARLAGLATARRDPVRLTLLDVLRRHAGQVCVCELVALFDLSQPTISHHLKVLRDAGLVDSERRGLWAYYYALPERLEELTTWLS
jgi:ArsR family transcriptional regulator